jgi:hypothetical protein
MVDTLAANQTLMMARNERLEKQYEELKSMLLASQGHAPMNRSQVSNSPAKNQLEELDPMNCINQAPSLSSRNKKTLLQSQVCNNLAFNTCGELKISSTSCC